MIYNNFSDIYKKVLVNSENKVKELWYKELKEIDVFFWILQESRWWLKEIFQIYGINEGLIEELLSIKEIFWKQEPRPGVYSGMQNSLKETILLSVKIASNFSKSRASCEDFLLALLKNKGWFHHVLAYVWINPEDIEKNLIDLNKMGAIDGMQQKNNIPENKIPIGIPFHIIKSKTKLCAWPSVPRILSIGINSSENWAWRNCPQPYPVHGSIKVALNKT